MLEDRLRTQGAWLGASCVPLFNGSHFVFAARIVGETVEISGVGGKVEPGETFRAAAEREFGEEAGRAVRIAPWTDGVRLGLHQPGPVPDGVAAFVTRRPPDHPDGGRLHIAVFAGWLDELPQPIEKITHFCLVRPEWSGLDLDEVDVVDELGRRPAEEAFLGRAVRLVDTAAAIVRASLLPGWRERL
jgi:8-oxo-dGTP pyrophosphatase MutT (NUDIX family)